ncbi:MAG: type IV pilus modification protein PilV [Gammaproteobacteria bacterium]
MSKSPLSKSQRGITLLESLVALLVLSIGLLGTAHLMATGIKYSNSSFARTQATLIAENIAERMRANPNAITGMNYGGFDSNTITNCTTPPATYCQQKGSTTPASCTAAQLATFDTFHATCGSGGSVKGNNGVKDLLLGGRLSVACDDSPCTATSTYTIRVSWNETELVNNADVTNTKLVQHVILP